MKKQGKGKTVGTNYTIPFSDKQAIESHIDEGIGLRLKFRRGVLGFTQEELAKKLGITFQQVQKYESGKDRVSSSRLWDLANVLDVPVSFFFEDLASQENSPLWFKSPSKKTFKDPKVKRPSSVVQEENDLTELIQAYLQIKDEAVRRNLLELAKSLVPKKPLL